MSSLELLATPAQAHDIQRVSPTQHGVGAKLHACQALAQAWPEAAGAYDLMLRDRLSKRDLTTRVWLDAAAGARSLQEGKSTLVGVHHGTLLLRDGSGLWVGRLPDALGFVSEASYQDLSSLTEPVGIGYGPRGLTWEAVIGDAAGLAPSAARLGDQLLLSGIDVRWSTHSPNAEVVLASWARDIWLEDVWAFQPTPGVLSVILESERMLRRVSLVKAADCLWSEREDWRIELPLERDVVAAGLNVHGDAAAIVVERRAPARSVVQLLDDRNGKPKFTAPYSLPEGFTWPTHTSAAARVDLTGTLRGAFMGRVPGVGFVLFELTSRADVLEAKQTPLPVTSAVVGRVDYDGEVPIWVVRTADGRMGLGHGPTFEEACFVTEVVDAAPFIGGGGIAWQTAPGTPPLFGLCDRARVSPMRRRIAPTF